MRHHRYFFLACLTLALAACSAPDSQKPLQPAVPATPDPVALEYKAFVTKQSDLLVAAANEFVTAIQAGDLDAARARYATSRMFYERIEPIAEALGDLDPRIDAREGDVPESEWTGYHVLEKALWSPEVMAGNAKLTAKHLAVADSLLADIKLLRARIESVEITIPQMVTGAVELLNEVSATKVTGEEERYSHTDLYDFVANVQGAQAIYRLLQAKARTADAALSDRIEQAFQALNKLLANYEAKDGYIDYLALVPEDTKNLSRAVDALAEPLSRLGILVEE